MPDTDPRPLVLASDHAGLSLKRELVDALGDWGVGFEDLGTFDDSSVDYPDFAHDVARRIVAGSARLGVLTCGTGVGMSITANKHVGVRAVVCSEPFSARLAREHNDANVLCLGARVVGVGLGRDILRAFVDARFERGRHAARVAKIELA